MADGIPDDVVWLHVVVDEVASVEVRECAGLLLEDEGAVGWGEGAAPLLVLVLVLLLLLLGAIVDVLVETFA